jgi:hypothetical protein
VASLVFFDSNVLVYADDLSSGAKLTRGKKPLGAACRRRDGCRVVAGAAGPWVLRS